MSESSRVTPAICYHTVHKMPKRAGNSRLAHANCSCSPPIGHRCRSWLGAPSHTTHQRHSSPLPSPRLTHILLTTNMLHDIISGRLEKKTKHRVITRGAEGFFQLVCDGRRSSICRRETQRDAPQGFTSMLVNDWRVVLLCHSLLGFVCLHISGNKTVFIGLH